MSKVDKQKRKAELEAHIRGDDLYDENEEGDFVDLRDDDSDSDPETTRARQASIRSQQQWEKRQQFRRGVAGHGSQYDAGGSSGAGGSAQRMPKGSGIANVLRRSQSVRETGGSGRNWIKPNAPEARLRAMDVELQKSKSTKQRKISTMNLQKLKERLGRAVSKFILYNRIPFNAVDSEYTQPMLDVAAEVGPGVKGPSAYEVSEVYLGMEHDEMTEWIGSFKGIWAERGVSIMCDGWSSLTRQHIINFLVYCNRVNKSTEWWIIHGSCAPELKKIAVKVLNQTTTSSHCERNWSTFSLIHTKTRNRLKYKKIQRLVFITYNMRLKLRHVKRSSQEEIDRSFNPINLDYIFEEDDPISPWIEERENPLLDGVDNSEWLDLVSDDDGGGGNDSNGDGGDGSDGNDGGGTHRYQARRTSQSSTPTPTQSDNSGGLTPSDGGGDDGDGEGTSHGDSGGGGGDNGGDGGDGTSFGVGSEDFIGGFGLCDVGEHYDIGEPVAPLPQLPRRFRGSDTRRDERRIRSREQQA
ncbi:unnamed protein product [Camellia sinensis]